MILVCKCSEPRQNSMPGLFWPHANFLSVLARMTLIERHESCNICIYIYIYIYIYVYTYIILILYIYVHFLPLHACFTGGHFGPSSLEGLGALPLGALPLGAFFSSDFRFDRRYFLLFGQVEKSSLRLFREGCV